MPSSARSRIFLSLLLTTLPLLLIIQIAPCGAKIEITQLPNGECLVNGMAWRSSNERGAEVRNLPFRIYHFGEFDSSFPYQLIVMADGELALIEKATNYFAKCKWNSHEKIKKKTKDGYVTLMSNYAYYECLSRIINFNYNNDADPCRYMWFYAGMKFLYVEFKPDGKLEFEKSKKNNGYSVERQLGSVVNGDNEYLLVELKSYLGKWFRVFRTNPKCTNYKRQGRSTLDFVVFKPYTNPAKPKTIPKVPKSQSNSQSKSKKLKANGSMNFPTRRFWNSNFPP